MLRKVLLGFVTILPLLAVADVLLVLFAPNLWPPAEAFVSKWFLAAWVFAVVGFVSGYALSFHYLRIVYRSTTVESERQFWAGFLMRFFPISGPVFWYRVIWKGLSVSEATIRA